MHASLVGKSIEISPISLGVGCADDREERDWSAGGRLEFRKSRRIQSPCESPGSVQGERLKSPGQNPELLLGVFVSGHSSTVLFVL
jgi:hypothetical protein